MPLVGLKASFEHEENGMTADDMEACVQVANRLNEVIIFRSTGPWSMRWIERNYPTKNFHVKGKSSDWGPMAGFVPALGKYSKVSGDADKERAGNKYNEDGLKGQYTSKVHLSLTLQELEIQLSRRAANTTALTDMVRAHDNKDDFILYANRSSDRKKFAFRAEWDSRNGSYKIYAYLADAMEVKSSIYSEKLASMQKEAIEVMTSSEVGANNRPLTGDYDLMAVCPAWANLNSRSVFDIRKDGVNFGRNGGIAEPGISFGAGVNLDAPLDMRLHTGMKGRMVNINGRMVPATGHGGDNPMIAATYNNIADSTPNMSREHNDLGNVTARIVRCINELNNKMGQNGPFRRVHHNAESHRSAIFGGITAADMGKGEAFPLTVFHPSQLKIGSPYNDSIITLLNLAEFRDYAVKLNEAGYFVPRSWVWGMSIRDGYHRGKGGLWPGM